MDQNKQLEKYRIVRKETLAKECFRLVVRCPDIAKRAQAGQFAHIRAEGFLLRRPISICEVDRAAGAVTLVFEVRGEGTKVISELREGDLIDMLAPLGNGFSLLPGKKAILIGGGIGIPPMLELAKNLNCEKTAVIGYRDKETFLADELRKYADVVIATEDGSVGTKGNVIDAIRAEKLTADIIYACGPTPMLKALKTYAMENGIECYISLEEKMACGIGACLGCVCHSKDVDEHSNVRNKRICKDGPVFRAEEVELLTPDEQRERIASGIMIKKEEQA